MCFLAWQRSVVLSSQVTREIQQLLATHWVDGFGLQGGIIRKKHIPITKQPNLLGIQTPSQVR